MVALKSSLTKPGAGALGLLLLGAVTGVIKVPGFSLAPAATIPPRKTDLPPPPPPPPPPVGSSAFASKGTLSGGAVTAQATLGQAKLLRGADGSLFLHVGVDATSEVADRERRPIDLSLVLDTSGSMNDQNKIGLLREACLGIADRLHDQDRITVVTFANEARVVYPFQVVGAAGRRDQLRRVIAGLVASGGTNLSSGLLAGADELRKVSPLAGAARRIVLMTDGLANAGIQSAPELASLTGGLAREGFTVSTVGLGLEYNESLLSSMADAGGGAYHYADRAERLAKIYDAEVESTRALVARDVRISIAPSAGIAIETVYQWPTTGGAGGALDVSLGDLPAGRHQKVVARVRVPTGKPASALAVASVSLRYQDVRGSRAIPVSTGSVLLGVDLVSETAVADASVAKELSKDLGQIEVADALVKARDAAFAGRKEEAEKALLVIEKKAGKDLTWTRGDGSEAKTSVDALRRGLMLRAQAPAAAPGQAAPEAEQATKLADECGRAKAR